MTKVSKFYDRLSRLNLKCYLKIPKDLKQRSFSQDRTMKFQLSLESFPRKLTEMELNKLTSDRKCFKFLIQNKS